MSHPDNNERADKAAIAADNAVKTDLTQGTDAAVGDGTEQVPVKADPFEARKALFKKQRDVRGDRVAREAAVHPDAADLIAVLAEEAGQGSSANELDRGSHMDTNRSGRAPDHPSRAPKAESVNTLDALPDRVKVKVLGQEYEVPKEDVEDAGGLKAYQLERAASIRLQRVAAEEARLKQERADFDQQRASAGRNAPAQAPVGTTGAASTQTGDAGTGADVEDRAAAIAADLYSGDPKRAKAAIAQVLQANNAPAATLDPAEVARQAADLLRQQDNAPATVKRPLDAARDAEIDELNSMMAERFSDVLSDQTMKQQALDRFNQLKADPANHARRLVDLGRQAATEARAQGPNPRQAVLERKQQLPPAVTGTQSHKPTAAQPKLSYIQQQRLARGQPI